MTIDPDTVLIPQGIASAAEKPPLRVTVDIQGLDEVQSILTAQQRKIRLLRRVLVDVQLGHHLPTELAVRIDKALLLTAQED